MGTTTSNGAELPVTETGDRLAGDSVRYLYAVCRGLPPQALDEVRGIGGEAVELVAHEDLMAVVSTVPMASFGETALRRNLEDLGWLESTVRAHDAVIHAVAVWAPTAPLRFATVCFDDDAVRARLREWHEPLTAALDRVEGCVEWSVKVLTRPEAPAAASDRAGLTGAEYLRRRKAETTRRAEGDEQAAATARLVDDELAGRSQAKRELPAQDPRLSGHQGTMVLNAAYLVREQDVAGFEATLAALAEQHQHVVLDARGPWPPYSFAMLDER